MSANDFNSAARTLEVGGKSYRYFNLQSLEEQGLGKISKLPFSIKVLLEAAVRQFDGRAITQEHVKQIAGWSEGRDDNKEIPLSPLASCCRTLPAFRSSSTWPPCATP